MTKQINKKGQRVFALLLAVAMMFSIIPLNSLAATTNDDGYIEIRTIEDLYNVRLDLTANYILMNDIDLTEATASGGDWDFMGNGWNPIGSNDVYGASEFSGVFDGNGHSIIGMRIDGINMPSGTGTKYVGLFAYITGTVHDLRFEKATITWTTSGSGYFGTVAGAVGNTGYIYNVEVDTNITVKNSTGKLSGGIVGLSRGTISRCATFGSVSYTYSTSSGVVHTSGVGGIVGIARGGTISQCYNTATLLQENTNTGAEGFVGGICGHAYYYSSSTDTPVVIENCYNTGTIKSSHNYYIAGIVGSAEGSTSYKHTITKCYNIGSCLNTSGNKNSGAYGIIDLVEGNFVTVSGCYYLQDTGKSNTGATALTAGQLKLQSSYSAFDFKDIWVMDTNAFYPYPQLKNNPQDLRVLKTVSLVSDPDKTEYKYGESIDLTGALLEIEYKDGSVEAINVSQDMISGYSATTPGTQIVEVIYKGFTNTFTVRVNEIVYIPVYTIEDLYNIRDDLTANYVLMNDIDLTEATAKGGDWDFGGKGWNPIGSNDVYEGSAFSGEFNGNGFSIIGMRIEGGTSSKMFGEYYLGLFANITGNVYDLNIVGGSIKTAVNRNKLYCGAVAGKMTGNIYNVKVSMDEIVITTNDSGENTAYIGGVVGYLCGEAVQVTNKTNISAQVYGTSNSTAVSIVGGIVGYGDNASVKESYNTGDLDEYSRFSGYTYDGTNGYIAGIVGNGSSTQVSNCYNTGTVTTETNVSAGIGNRCTINNCYNIGKSDNAIGSAGEDNYYLDGTGSNSTGSTALTETQLKIQSMFKGFDFDNVWILNEFANYPYPQLRDNIQDLSESASLVSIIALPVKTEYMVGDSLSFDGAMVKVVYVSGREEIIGITDAIVSGFDMNAVGEQTVTVTVAGASDTYAIVVNERPEVTAVAITSQPSKKTFAIGTAFDFTGAKAKVTYKDGTTEIVDITADMTTGGDINHIGKQTITFTFGGKSATFDVEVKGIAIEKIKLSVLPDKLTYLEGQALDLTGMVVTAVMNNGLESSVASGYTVSGYSSVPGKHTVTITYLEKSTTFEVTVIEKTLVSLRINYLPNKLEYVAGEEFDARGMQIIATYDNGDVLVADNYTISGFDATPGIKNVVVSLDGESVSFTVKIIAKVVTEIALVSLPSKVDYIEYESFDSTGLKVQATYNDGTTELVTDYKLTGFSSNVGTHTIMVAYAGFVQTFDIVVSPRVLVDVKVKAPTKVTYDIGEAFDATGMEVIACYNNGQEFPVDSYTMTGFDSATAGTKEITITYVGFTRSFAVAVTAKSSIDTNGAVKVDNVKGRLGETVEVPVAITQNSGLTAFCHTIKFDKSALKFVSATAVNGFAKGTVVVNTEKASKGEITVLWFQATNVTESGIAYTLQFEVLETAADGTSAITISFDENDNGNASGENVIFEAVNGSVEVLSYWLGDLDGDREYKMADLLKLAQYVSGQSMSLTAKQLKSADVNEDGTIDVHDVTLLSQWLLEADM